MRILWVSNILFPEAKNLITGKNNPIVGTGGWLQASAEALASNCDIQLAIATISKLVNQLVHIKGEIMDYYILPQGKGNLRFNSDYIPMWKEINNDYKPDIIHLHGTELPHGYSLLEALPQANTIISIQGLMSQIWKYHNAGMSTCDILCNITLRDIVYDLLKPKALYGTLFSRKRNFKIRGEQEIKIYKKAKAVIGRTTWDKANVLAINPNLKYYFCNETLRPEFYHGKWEYAFCEPHTIFLSQATYPFKGLHMIIKALPLIISTYPNTKVYVGGPDLFHGSSCLDGYGKYIKGLMKKLKVSPEHIVFTGPLNAEEMRRQYLHCNVFVSPSAIENSPNSVCEAQMLGVPCIASNVGGTSDMIPNQKCGLLYRFEDIELLAYYIMEVFTNSPSFNGEYEQELAKTRHHSTQNLEQLLLIYSQMTE